MQALFFIFILFYITIACVNKVCFFYLPLRVPFGLAGNSHNGGAAACLRSSLLISATWKTPLNPYCTPLCIKDIYEQKKRHACALYICLIFILDLGKNIRK